MNDIGIVRWLASPEWEHIIGTFLHSLWLGAVLAVALAIVLRCTINPVIRYRCSLAALGLLVGTGLVTWAILSAPKVPEKNSEAAELAEAERANSINAAETSGVADKIVVMGQTSLPDESTLWTVWFAGVWLFGAVLMLLRTGIKVASAERLRRSCRELTDESTRVLVAKAVCAVGVTQRIRVAVTDKLTSPAVVGVLVPTLILPLSLFTALTPTQIQFVLLHELAHIRRGDYLANLFQLFAEAILFFNPAVWWISHQVRREREACCDAVASQLSGAPADYAKTLVQVAENILQATPAVAPAFRGDGRGESSLAERVQRVLIPGYRPSLGLTWRTLLVSFFVGAALLAVSAYGTRNTIGAIISSAQAVTDNSPPISNVSPEAAPVENFPVFPTISEQSVQKNTNESISLITRTFQVEVAAFSRALGKISDETGGLEATNFIGAVRNFFRTVGVNLDPQLGKAVYFSDRRGQMWVRATVEEMELIEEEIARINQLAESAEKLFTRMYKVGRYSLEACLESATNAVAAREAMKIQSGSASLVVVFDAIRNALLNHGVDLSPSEGKSVFLNLAKGELWARGTLSELDAIEHLFQTKWREPDQVHLKIRYVEVSGDATSWWNSIVPTNRWAVFGVLSEEQMRSVLRGINQGNALKLNTEGQVTTVSGRQAQIQIAEPRMIATGIHSNALSVSGIRNADSKSRDYLHTESVSFGPVIDLLPQVTDDRMGVTLRTIATMTEFLGYAENSPEVTIFVNGKRTTTPLPLPRYKVRQATNECVLLDGQTLALFDFSTKEVVKQPNGEFIETPIANATNQLWVFVTAMILDPTGSRVNLQK